MLLRCVERKFYEVIALFAKVEVALSANECECLSARRRSDGQLIAHVRDGVVLKLMKAGFTLQQCFSSRREVCLYLHLVPL